MLIGVSPVRVGVVRAVAVATVVAWSMAWSTTARSATPRVPPEQALATLLGDHDAFATPNPRAAVLLHIEAHRPLTGVETVLPVLGSRTGAEGVLWLRVLLPGRPNGLTGWIRSSGTRRSTTSWHIVVETAARRVVVYRAGRPVRTAEAVVGKPSTPTPEGSFYVEEVLQLPASAVGAPFALALSARSNVLQEFDGGPGQIALHGLDNVGGTVGTAASHGCVRLDSETMRWLVIHISPGVPVTITG